MRVWLVDDRKGDATPALEAVLRTVAERSEGRVVLLGCGPFRPTLPAELRGGQLDLLVVHDPSWPADVPLQDVLDAGLGLLLAATPERAEQFLPLAELYPVWTLSPAPDADALALALSGAHAAQRRHAHWKAQVQRLEQRLADRIIIERAKGILVQRLAITEDEAYKRLRVLSRRQRRQIRDIAQSLLDTESLLLPEVNGARESEVPESRPVPHDPPPAS